MTISAIIKNDCRVNDITVNTDDSERKIYIPGKEIGGGSSVNGGEMLFLALATCFCNDLYREAGRRKIILSSVEVRVSGEFGNEGESVSDIVYEVKAHSSACDQNEINDLICYVDTIAEIHNTIRKGAKVSLKQPDN